MSLGSNSNSFCDILSGNERKCVRTDRNDRDAMLGQRLSKRRLRFLPCDRLKIQRNLLLHDATTHHHFLLGKRSKSLTAKSEWNFFDLQLSLLTKPLG